VAVKTIVAKETAANWEDYVHAKENRRRNQRRNLQHRLRKSHQHLLLCLLSKLLD